MATRSSTGSSEIVLRRAVLLIFTSILILTADSAAALETISPTDPNIRYTGRFNTSNASQPVFSWSGTSIAANFQGTSLQARFDGDSWGQDYLQVIIDDGDPVRLNLSTSASNYTLATGLADAVHTVEIVKESESWNGDIKFLDFKLDDGKSLVAPPARPPIKLEFYGDSGTAGTSGLSECNCGNGLNKTSYYNYSGITSRMLDAEYSNVSRGGLTISDNGNRITDIWDQKSFTLNSPTWDFNSYTPDAVVVSLGANDVYGQSKSEIMTAWKSFVTNQLRPVYPDAHIVFANFYGWHGNEPANYIHEAVEDLHDAGDTNVSFVKLPWLFSTGGHAVVSENAGYANILAPHLAEKLGLPAPTPNTLSSFGAPGEVGNGSLEASHTAGEVNGWRALAGGSPTYVEGAGDAHEGTDFVRVTGGGGYYHSTDASEGDEFTLSAWMRGDPGDDGNLKIEFRGQGQNLLSTINSLHAVTGSWQEFTT